MTAVSPVTKAARHAQIAAILTHAHPPVRSQEELADRLAQRGARVTQATLSRDLEELGAVRLRGADGGLVYALPGEPGGPGSRPGGLSDWRQVAARAEPPAGAGRAAGQAGQDPGGDQVGGEQAGRQDGRSEAGRSDTGRSENGGSENGGSDTGRSENGEPPGRLSRVAAELLLAAEASANLVVLRTPAGAAQFLASVLDHASLPSVLGTVAGDDTVLVISRDPAGGDDLARALLALAERRGHRTAPRAASQAAAPTASHQHELGTPLRRTS